MPELASTSAPALELFAPTVRAPYAPTSPSTRRTSQLPRRSAVVWMVFRSPSSLRRRGCKRWSLTEVADGLDHRFRLLTSGTRTAPRQRSLSAAVAWSYDLLDDEMQRPFDALGVFSGPFSAAAGITVAALEDESMLVRARRTLARATHR